KENRSRARFKFVVKKLGMEELKRVVAEEREKLRPDPRWTAFLADLHATDEKPLKPPSKLGPGPYPAGFEEWRRTNVRPQRQEGYVVAAVTLPLAEAAVPAAAGPAQEERRTSTKRVLIVDDNVDAADALRMVLEVEGHRVETAYSASEAFEKFARFHPDVVLLDIGLPETDGYEVARWIRRRPDGQGVMLYALTGWAQEEDRRRAFEAGFDQHLTKPVDIETLRRLIGERATRRDARATGSPGQRGAKP
ncbi:MAG: response regulator, partial [Gammaproteobacteria bacterium]